MKLNMSCEGQKKLLTQNSQCGYEDLTKVGDGSHHGGKGEEALLPGASLQEGTCPQCKRLLREYLRVVYVCIGLVVLCLGLVIGMGLVQYMQYVDSQEFSQRLDTYCPPSGTAPPGSPGQVGQGGGQVGKPPRGAGVPGGPWDLVPPTAPDYGEEEEDDLEEGQRNKRSASGESGDRAASGGRRTRHRHKRCISCPTNMVNHVHAAPSGNLLSGAYPDVRSSSDMFRNWRMADWSTGVKNIFNATTGLLTIVDPGLYWVYGQVMFYNSVFDNGFAVKVFRYSETVSDTDGEHLAMCMHTTDYNNPDTPQYNDKYRTCNVGIPAMLNTGDRIGIASLYEGRMVVFSPASSFYGAIKLLS